MKSTLLFLRVSILSIALSIVLGAFGAHSLKDVFGSYELDVWNKGILYQLTNSLGLILIILLKKNELITESKLGLSFLSTGILFFSGSLYTIALTNVYLNPDHWIKIMMIPITPIGGTLIIIGWSIIFFKIKKIK